MNTVGTVESAGDDTSKTLVQATHAHTHTYTRTLTHTHTHTHRYTHTHTPNYQRFMNRTVVIGEGAGDECIENAWLNFSHTHS